MTDELVSRLRTVAAGQTWVVAETACNEAADELEARARRIAELERVLHPFAVFAKARARSAPDNSAFYGGKRGPVLTYGDFRRANAALRTTTSFFASLSPEQQDAALAYQGPENHGPTPPADALAEALDLLQRGHDMLAARGEASRDDV